MHAHTPGPWRISDQSPTIIKRDFRMIGSEGGELIGSAVGHPNSGFFVSEEQAEANARLMALSPDLLEAVAMLAAALNDAIPAIITAGVEGGYRFRAEKHALGHAFLLCHAHALIAKATGNT